MKYGEIPRPEDQQRIDVIEDPTKVLLSCYEMYLKLCPHIGLEVDRAEVAYNIACKILEGKERLNPDAEAVLNGMNAHKTSEAKDGVFLSAVLNKTKLDNLILPDARQSFIGYRLAPGKFLAVEAPFQHRDPDMRCNLWYVGTRAEGGVLVSFAERRCFAEQATGGVQIAFCLGYGVQSYGTGGMCVCWSRDGCIENPSLFRYTEGAIAIKCTQKGPQEIRTACVAADILRNQREFYKNFEGRQHWNLPKGQYKAPWKNAALNWADNMEKTLQPLNEVCLSVSSFGLNEDQGTRPVYALRAFDWDGLQKTIEAKAKRLEDIIP